MNVSDDMPSIKRESCEDKDCKCMICRELSDCRMPANLETPPRREGVNFILRRGLPFTNKSPTKEWLNISDNALESTCDEDCIIAEKINHRRKMGDTMTHVVVGDNNLKKADKDVAHKTVIYFGDTNQRQQSKFNGKEGAQSATKKEESKIGDFKKEEQLVNSSEDGRCGDMDKNERQRSTLSLIESEEVEKTKVTHEIVVNVSPSREDVLRIEEDESQVVDYWSLPGDNTGFKADWSFVQQWRLRG